MSKKNKVISKEQAYVRMARICSQKEYSTFDISQKLLILGFSEQVRREIINQLRKDNYLNEERYTRSYVNDKLRFNKWGRKKIELNLRQKQIPHNVINDVFSEYSDSTLNQSLQPLLENKWKTVKGNSEYEKTGKLIKYALGRGFEMNEILNCLKNMNLSGFI